MCCVFVAVLSWVRASASAHVGAHASVCASVGVPDACVGMWVAARRVARRCVHSFSRGTRPSHWRGLKALHALRAKCALRAWRACRMWRAWRATRAFRTACVTCFVVSLISHLRNRGLALVHFMFLRLARASRASRASRAVRRVRHVGCMRVRASRRVAARLLVCVPPRSMGVRASCAFARVACVACVAWAVRVRVRTRRACVCQCWCMSACASVSVMCWGCLSVIVVHFSKPSL